MAHRHTYHPQHTNYSAGVKSHLPKKTPSTSQVLAVVTLLPVSGTLLFLAGITLIGTVIGLAVATLLFIIFSPVFVPDALSGFLGFRAFGLTGFSSLSTQAQFSQMRRVAIPPIVAPRMPMYPPGGAGFGQQLFYGQGPPAIFHSQISGIFNYEIMS
ncbi:oleosin H1-like [Apium graveolens]|uniref:oleosin H1-like n=1 Tax=Apium graveolens TaxID=4045 RepID=UPI003D7A55C5